MSLPLLQGCITLPQSHLITKVLPYTEPQSIQPIARSDNSVFHCLTSRYYSDLPIIIN